jgi:hypothetical protein
MIKSPRIWRKGHATLFLFRGCRFKTSFGDPKLDDGWPESVEEQGLLLLIWRHLVTGQYIKDVL